MNNLNEILQLIAAQLRTDGKALIEYAAEDTIGGYHVDASRSQWPTGSIWENEGKILYALTRVLQPELIVQVGGWVGCSAAHFAAACKANSKGHVISVDNGGGGVMHGALIPTDLLQYVELVAANGEDWLATQKDNSIELIFEDATHSREMVGLMSRLALQKLVMGGLLINHDAAHDFAILGDGQRTASDMGYLVRSGLEDAGARFKPYRTDESDCGLSITQKPYPEGVFIPDKYSEKVDVNPIGEIVIPDIELQEMGDIEPPKPERKKPGRKPKSTKI